MAALPLLFCLLLTAAWGQTRSIWQYHLGPIVLNPYYGMAPSQDHTAQQNGFALSDPIPADGDDWLDCYPGDSYCKSGSQINTQAQVSRFPDRSDCWRSFAFAYFQTNINVPMGVTPTQFTVEYPGNIVDDAARISIYNSIYPNGQTLSFTFYQEASTVDLVQYLATGDNRLIITQEDSCCCGNTVYAIIKLNGVPLLPTCVPPAQAPCFSSAWDPTINDCRLTPISGPSCDDGLFCTSGDVCNNGVCTGTPTSGASCDDGLVCTSGDVCTNGVCTGTPVICPAPQCQAATCNEMTACAVPVAAYDGEGCNDMDPCTQNDTCSAGNCAGIPVTCTASDQCHVAGTCTDGVCSNPAVEDGTACDDGDACTLTDRCVAGVCTGSDPVVCEASDQCHVAGTCDPATGICDNPAKCDGKICDDGNACTQLDTCKAGVCVGIRPVVCTVESDCHVAGECNVTTGKCSYDHKCDGSTCDDANACTVDDTCLDGECQSGAEKECQPVDQCHNAACDATTGECAQTAKADGSPCDDGNACTQTDTCLAGVCVGAEPKFCYASDSCHLPGVCDPQTGECSDPKKADGTFCDDDNACTRRDTCRDGVCCGGQPVICKASDQCHGVGTCDTETGKCSDPKLADGTTCNDRDLCTETDVCTNGKCVGSGQKCCRTTTGRCGTCVNNCRGNHQSVLNLFKQWGRNGRPNTADDVDTGRGGGCAAGLVCCVPKDQSTCRNDNNSCRIPE